MNASVEAIKEAAETLPESDRVAIAEYLLSTLAQSPDIEPALHAELDERETAFLAGKDSGVPWEDVRNKLKSL